MVIIGKVTNDRAVLSDYFIQLTMNTSNVDVISKYVSLIKVVNLHKDIIEHLKVNVLLIELRSQQIVPVTVKLQSKRSP